MPNTIHTTPDLNDKSIILSTCGDNQHELVILESGHEAFSIESDNNGCLSDSCSSYCPSASDNDSETDDEFLDGTTPSTVKKIYSI